MAARMHPFPEFLEDMLVGRIVSKVVDGEEVGGQVWPHTTCLCETPCSPFLVQGSVRDPPPDVAHRWGSTRS
jgi:hypothetical protein